MNLAVPRTLGTATRRRCVRRRRPPFHTPRRRLRPRTGSVAVWGSVAFTLTGIKVEENGAHGISNIVVSEVTDMPIGTTTDILRSMARGAYSVEPRLTVHV